MLDDEGRKFATNTASEGRYHSKWLNMMFPRLYLAKNLLKDEGVIFISIDDNEMDNLRRLCNEIFGEENFCAQFVWNTEGNTDNQYKVKVNHEYILAYYKNVNSNSDAVGRVIDPNTPEDSNLRKGYADNNINKNNPENPPAIVELPVGFPCSVNSLFYEKKELDEEFFEQTTIEKFISDEIKEKYSIEAKSGLPIKIDDMVVEDGKLVKPCRIYVGMANKNKLLEFINNECQPILEDGMPMSFYINSNAAVRYRKKVEKPRNILSVLRGLGTTEKSKTHLRTLGLNYDYPKPVGLIEYLIRIGCENDDIIMDFFAGSGSTAEAVYRSNVEDEKNRKFVLVQLPEKTEEKSQAFKAGYKTLSEITLERIKRSARAVQDQSTKCSDFGVKFFKLSQSCFREWQSNTNAGLEKIQAQLDLSVDNIVEGKHHEDILFEILLKAGFEPTESVTKLDLCSKSVYSVANGALLICLEGQLTAELIDQIIALEPMQFICLDQGFQGNDQLKANTAQAFKARSQESEAEMVFKVV